MRRKGSTRRPGRVARASRLGAGGARRSPGRRPMRVASGSSRGSCGARTRRSPRRRRCSCSKKKSARSGGTRTTTRTPRSDEVILELVDEAVAAGARLEQGVRGHRPQRSARVQRWRAAGRRRRRRARARARARATSSRDGGARRRSSRSRTRRSIRDLSPEADRSAPRRRGRLRRVGVDASTASCASEGQLAHREPRAAARRRARAERARRDGAEPGLVLGHHVPAQRRPRRASSTCTSSSTSGAARSSAGRCTSEESMDASRRARARDVRRARTSTRTGSCCTPTTADR